MTRKIFTTTAEVADLLSISPGYLLRLRGQLECETGFPAPMPHSQRPLRWRRDQIEAWIMAQGTPATPDIDPALLTAGQVVLLNEARKV